MNPTSLTLGPHALGDVHEDAQVTVFLGHRGSSIDELQIHFPDYRFSVLKQMHSDAVVRAPFTPPPPAADAQWTKELKIALCIRTADCIPVLVFDPESGMTAAIHAGWRGIENGIILKTLHEMRAAGASMEGARAWIGPHIGKDSFEVRRDVGALLEARFDAVRGSSPLATSLLPHANPEKTYVNLSAIARAQLSSGGIEPDRTTFIDIDTFTSGRHESYRRDSATTGRQVSFIALK